MWCFTTLLEMLEVKWAGVTQCLPYTDVFKFFAFKIKSLTEVSGKNGGVIIKDKVLFKVLDFTMKDVKSSL